MWVTANCPRLATHTMEVTTPLASSFDIVSSFATDDSSASVITTTQKKSLVGTMQVQSAIIIRDRPFNDPHQLISALLESRRLGTSTVGPLWTLGRLVTHSPKKSSPVSPPSRVPSPAERRKTPPEHVAKTPRIVTKPQPPPKQQQTSTFTTITASKVPVVTTTVPKTENLLHQVAKPPNFMSTTRRPVRSTPTPHLRSTLSIALAPLKNLIRDITSATTRFHHQHNVFLPTTPPPPASTSTLPPHDPQFRQSIVAVGNRAVEQQNNTNTGWSAATGNVNKNRQRLKPVHNSSRNRTRANNKENLSPSVFVTTPASLLPTLLPSLPQLTTSSSSSSLSYIAKQQNSKAQRHPPNFDHAFDFDDFPAQTDIINPQTSAAPVVRAGTAQIAHNDPNFQPPHAVESIERAMKFAIATVIVSIVATVVYIVLLQIQCWRRLPNGDVLSSAAMHAAALSQAQQQHASSHRRTINKSSRRTTTKNVERAASVSATHPKQIITQNRVSVQQHPNNHNRSSSSPAASSSPSTSVHSSPVNSTLFVPRPQRTSVIGGASSVLSAPPAPPPSADFRALSRVKSNASDRGGGGAGASFDRSKQKSRMSGSAVPTPPPLLLSIKSPKRPIDSNSSQSQAQQQQFLRKNSWSALQAQARKDVAGSLRWQHNNAPWRYEHGGQQQQQNLPVPPLPSSSAPSSASHVPQQQSRRSSTTTNNKAAYLRSNSQIGIGNNGNSRTGMMVRIDEVAP